MFRRFCAPAIATAAPRRVAAAAMPMMSKRFMGFPEGYAVMNVAKVGEPAPNFSVDAYDNGNIVNKVGLSTYAGKKVVLLFYPLDFTFVCPTELIAFSDRVADFEKLNAQVLAVSTDSVNCHKAWAETPRKKGGVADLKMPMLADLTHDLCRDYGVLMEDKGIALRGLFILDEKHVLQSATVNNLPLGRNVDEALRICEAIDQARDGVVVPCNWTPGKPLLEVKKSDEFFEKTN